MEPYWTVRSGSIPFWMVFNMEPSASSLERYLDDRDTFDDIAIMLFSHGVESVGLAPIERWRALLRALFTASAYGWTEGLLSVPRLVVGNVIAMLAAFRAVSLHLGGGARRWDKTRHIFPAELPQ